MRSTPIDLVGIGVSVWDTILSVDQFPTPGSVSPACDRYEGIGGGVSVAIATAAKLGRSTALIDSLGDDTASLAIIDRLRQQGVLLDGLMQSPGASASVASIWSDLASAERTIVFSPGSAVDLIQWRPVHEAILTGAKILHLNGRHLTIAERAMDLVQQSGGKISFDGGAHRYRDETTTLLRRADIAIVARQYAQQHYQRQTGRVEALTPQQLVRFLRDDLSAELVGVTDGIHGSYLAPKEGQAFHQLAMAAKATVDTTGCGDTYHGAFLSAYVAGADAKQSAQVAASVAAQNAENLGAFAFA